MGIAIGMGYYLIAVAGCVIVMVTLTLLQRVIHVNAIKNVEVKFIHRVETIAFINEYFQNIGIKVVDVDFHVENRGEDNLYTNIYTLDMQGKATLYGYRQQAFGICQHSRHPNAPTHKEELPMGQHSIVVVGGNNVDITATSITQLVYGDSNPGTIHTGLGGVGRNIAENLTRMGQKVSLITVFGDDEFSRLAQDQAQRIGMDISDAIFVSNAPSCVYVCINEPRRRNVGRGQRYGAVHPYHAGVSCHQAT